MPSVFWSRSSPIVLPITKRDGIAAYCDALPIADYSSEPMPALRPKQAKSTVCAVGPIRNDGTRIHGEIQANSARWCGCGKSGGGRVTR